MSWRPPGRQLWPHYVGQFIESGRGGVIIQHPILFFDGECALCHGSVKWLLARDTAGVLRFAPIGGETWEQCLAPEVRQSLPESVILVIGRGSKPLVRSNAVLTALALLGPPWKKRAALLSTIPAPLRDACYRLVARVRRLIMGRAKTACPMVPPEWRPRLLP